MRVELGMQRTEAYQHTLVELNQLLRHRERVRRREIDFPIGRLHHCVINMMREDPIGFYELLPHLDEEATTLTPEEREAKHAELLANKIKGAFAGFM